MSARRPIALVGLVALAAACVGDDDAADAPPTAAIATSAPVTTTPATTTPATTTPASTTPASTTPASTTPATTELAPELDDWCGLAAVVAERDAERDDIDFTDPAAVEDYLGPVPGLLAQSVALAPPEIAAAVATSAANSLAIYRALEGNGFDMLTLDLSDAGLDLEAGDAAVEAIDAYNADVCGLSTDEAGVPAVDVGDGSLRDLFVDQLSGAGFAGAEAECLFDVLDFGDAEALTDDAVESAFEVCGLDPARIDELSTVLAG